MQTRQRSRAKKKAAALLLSAALLASALVGTLAWLDYSQHRTNEFENRQPKYDVTLIENFRPRDRWRTSDREVTKEISVKNTGNPADNRFEEIYVRIQLKEYMDFTPMIHEQTPDRYMINTAGAFIMLTDAQVPGALATDTIGTHRTLVTSEWGPNRTVTKLREAITGQTGWFIMTREGDLHGQYGKFLTTRYEMGAKEFIIGDASMENARLDARKHNAHDDIPNAECSYPVHPWHGTNLADVRAQPGNLPTIDGEVFDASDYIRWHLGNDVVLLSDWDGEPGPFWIIDDRDGGSNWVYWGQALQPGEETSKFMESVELIRQPNGDFYYAIHVELQAVSIDELAGDNPRWTDAPAEILETIVGSSASVSFSWPAGMNPPFTLGMGATQAAPAVTVLPATADQAVTWRSTNTSVVTVNASTGVITVVGAGGFAHIVAENAATNRSASYRVTVDGVTPGAELAAEIARFDALTEADYTAPSWAASKAIVDAARLVLANPESTDQQLRDEAAKVRGAISSLVLALLETIWPPMPPGSVTRGYVPADENLYNDQGLPIGVYDAGRDGRANIEGLGALRTRFDRNFYDPMEEIYDSYGFIYLDTIIKDYDPADFSSLSISNIVIVNPDADPANAQFAATAVVLGQRNGRDAILIQYLPSRAEANAQIAASGAPGFNPEIPIRFRLAMGEASAEILVTAVYFAVLS